VDELRRLTDAPLVLGGSGFSVAPHGWLDRLGVSHGIVGEGERSFPAFLDALAAGRSPDGLPGVVSRGSGPARSAAGQDLAQVPAPAHDRADYPRYLARGGFVGVQSKRGCSSRCIYCTYPLLEGAACRLRPPEAVAEEIQSVHRATGAADFFFTDGVFNVPRDHALGLCRELASRRLPVRWMAYCNPVGLDRELAHAMAASGCIGVELGFDAATDKMLAALGKPFTTADIRSSLDALAHAKLPAAVHLLFGGPTETLADLADAQAFLDSCATPNAVFASLGLRIYAGTELERLARREGVLPQAADLFDPAYYVSEALGRDPLRALDRVARRRPEWSTPTDWTRLLMRLVQGILNWRGVRPQWRDVRNYGKYMRW
jgi:radical SAM superfamily enzyme YgiQ (UPF0313 family)